MGKKRKQSKTGLMSPHKSIKTTEIYSHLSDGYLHHVIQQLPGPNLGTVWAHLTFWKGTKLRKLLKTNWWAMQDLNLRLLPYSEYTRFLKKSP